MWIGLAVAVGVPSLFIGIEDLFDPAEDPLTGWIFLMFATICAAVPVWMRLGRRRDAVFSGQSGVVFPVSRSAGPAIAVTLAAAGTSAILLALSPELGSHGDLPLLVCCSIRSLICRCSIRRTIPRSCCTRSCTMSRTTKIGRNWRSLQASNG
ncbi:hypothetical protein ETD83_41260 [Actinomadura soli]|uniref:Uncharacterized protein n=1 Tax=Actinomadura soli TaxID=2508997 RepID=A0A5C4IYF6_9ACTN|nr:hypothetical protein [Actinomadura soli]TMQ82765.1 hypothetical protein ETD83_41260 [Actinomadura soli]